MKKIIDDKVKLIKKSNSEILKEPITAIKKLNFQKLNVIKSFSINKTFINFKEKLRKAELERIKTLKNDKIKQAKQEKLQQKKQKLEEARQIKREQDLKEKEEKKRLLDQEKQRIKIQKQKQLIEEQKVN